MDTRDQNEETQSGNLFGWKVSLIGLFVILFFLGLMVYRHYVMDVPFGATEEEIDEAFRPQNPYDKSGKND